MLTVKTLVIYAMSARQVLMHTLKKVHNRVPIFLLVVLGVRRRRIFVARRTMGYSYIVVPTYIVLTMTAMVMTLAR